MKPALASHPTGHNWGNLQNGWRRLYGDYERLGLSVEWHDFQAKQPLDWGVSCRPRSVEFCLSLDGRGAGGVQ